MSKTFAEWNEQRKGREVMSTYFVTHLVQVILLIPKLRLAAGSGIVVFHSEV